MPKRLGVSLAKDPARNKEDFPIVDNPCPHAAMSDGEGVPAPTTAIAPAAAPATGGRAARCEDEATLGERICIIVARALSWSKTWPLIRAVP